MKICHSLYLAVGCLAGISCLPLNALVLSGSDLMSGSIEAAIIAELSGMEEDVKVDLQGSLLSRQSLENGESQASILALPDSEDAPKSYRQYPIAYQIAVFAVHESNPVQELSYGELARLFGEYENIDSWSSLTDSVTWSDRKVVIRASRRDHLMTLELFNAQVLDEKPFKSEMQIMETSPWRVRDTILLDPTALLMLPYVEANRPAKILDIKAGEEDQSYNPSPENVFYGDYPLRLPFYLVVSESLEAGKVKALLEALLSPSVTKALAERNFVPLPDQEKRELLSRFD